MLRCGTVGGEGPCGWRWLHDGGIHICVCRYAERMAKDVDDALKEVPAARGVPGAEDAAAYFAGLAKAGRYARDVY